MENLLETIVGSDELHVRWLATLSHLENCGARKIVVFEPHQDVPLAVLQHAAEETRHAFFLRKLIHKINKNPPAQIALLGGWHGRRYLHQLDVAISRLLKERCGLNGRELKWGAYLLTTYAIEKRAEALYPLYESVLRRRASKISLLALIKEEENHLVQIEEELRRLPTLDQLKGQVQAWEEALYEAFVGQLRAQLALFDAYKPVMLDAAQLR